MIPAFFKHRKSNAKQGKSRCKKPETRGARYRLIGKYRGGIALSQMQMYLTGRHAISIYFSACCKRHPL